MNEDETSQQVSQFIGNGKCSSCSSVRCGRHQVPSSVRGCQSGKNSLDMRVSRSVTQTPCSLPHNPNVKETRSMSTTSASAVKRWCQSSPEQPGPGMPSKGSFSCVIKRRLHSPCDTFGHPTFQSPDIYPKLLQYTTCSRDGL